MHLFHTIARFLFGTTPKMRRVLTYWAATALLYSFCCVIVFREFKAGSISDLQAGLAGALGVTAIVAFYFLLRCAPLLKIQNWRWRSTRPSSPSSTTSPVYGARLAARRDPDRHAGGDRVLRILAAPAPDGPPERLRHRRAGRDDRRAGAAATGAPPALRRKRAFRPDHLRHGVGHPDHRRTEQAARPAGQGGQHDPHPGHHRRTDPAGQPAPHARTAGGLAEPPRRPAEPCLRRPARRRFLQGHQRQARPRRRRRGAAQLSPSTPAPRCVRPTRWRAGAARNSCC